MGEVLRPGSVSLQQWQRVYRGAAVTLDPNCYANVERSAAIIERVVAKGAPVYGVNTGFGKLASVRIDTADLERLQRNIVLSHSAGVGDPMPAPIVRLMMALKLASLGVGASGIRLPTLQLLEAMLAAQPVAGGAGAGFGGCFRRFGAARSHVCGDDRRGRDFG